MGHSTLKTCCIFIPMGDSTVPQWPTNLNLHFSVFTTIFLHCFGLKPSNREILPRPGDFSHREISCQTGRSPGGHREVARLSWSLSENRILLIRNWKLEFDVSTNRLFWTYVVWSIWTWLSNWDSPPSAQSRTQKKDWGSEQIADVIWRYSRWNDWLHDRRAQWIQFFLNVCLRNCSDSVVYSSTNVNHSVAMN